MSDNDLNDCSLGLVRGRSFSLLSNRKLRLFSKQLGGQRQCPLLPDIAIRLHTPNKRGLRGDSREKSSFPNCLNPTEKEGFRRDRVPFCSTILYSTLFFFEKNRTKSLKGFGVSGHISNLISGSDPWFPVVRLYAALRLTARCIF